MIMLDMDMIMSISIEVKFNLTAMVFQRFYPQRNPFIRRIIQMIILRRLTLIEKHFPINSGCWLKPQTTE